MKCQKKDEISNKTKSKKKWNEKIFSTQKVKKSVNVSLRQCQCQTISGSS